MGQAPKEAVAGEEKVGAVAPTGVSGFIAKFTVIFGAGRELWLTFLIKFLIYTAYSVTNKTMVLWLSKDLGFSDQAAGALVGWVWGAGNDDLYSARRLGDGRGRVAADVFSRCGDFTVARTTMSFVAQICSVCERQSA